MQKFSGFYTLDYLLDFRQTGEFSKLAQVPDWEASRDRISQGLKRLSPVLMKSFLDFTQSVMAKNVVKGREWIRWDLSKTLIDDQEISRRLPINCYKSDKLTLNLFQTVVRSYGSTAVEYRYQNDILENLRLQNPLQFSFFIVHEWLWDFTQNVSDLRRLNWVLHSEGFNVLEPEVWDRFFVRTQFFNRNLPVCHRSEAVKYQLEKVTGLACQHIKDEDLEKIESLELSALPRDYVFRSGDFARLYSLRSLGLNHNPQILDRIPPYSFNDLLNLEVVYALGSGFDKLPTDLADGAAKAKVRTLEK
ncbi:MAG: hypothetical protein IPM97_07865 [Bdellovibrionaceae bacterium]|nr:hypothetical protein [Pseudobdellovibrionaceae bacterium]